MHLRIHGFKALFPGEGLGSGSHPEDGFALIQDQARQLHRVAHRGDGPHRAGREPGTLHDGGIHLHPAPGIEHRAGACVEPGIVLQGHHGRLHRVQGTAPVTQDRPSPAGGRLAARQHVLVFGLGIAARATVDDQHGRAPHRSPTLGRQRRFARCHAARPHQRACMRSHNASK
jgi:hypothetical protein